MNASSHSRAARGCTALAASAALAVAVLPLHHASAAVIPSQALQSSYPSAVPAAWTPQVKDGKVLTISQVGSQMVVGGTFSAVAPSTGSPQSARTRVFAFDGTTGAINAGFAPNVNGDVNVVLPGPTAGTVLIGGAFTTVNGLARQGVALLSLSNGALVTTFNANLDGVVKDARLVTGRLFLAGTFSKIGGVAHKGLGTVNATTGAVDNFVNIQVAEHHNNSGSGAVASIGVSKISITPDGRTLAAIGNFRKADGLDRVQMFLADLSGTSAKVRTDWRTSRYEPLCYSWAFDTYVRGIDVSPDGRYVYVAAGGGGNPGTLCDSVSAWDLSDKTTDAQPAWVADSGGDTVYAVSATGAAVFTGGHIRWFNNAGSVDTAGAGSVPRPGLAAFDPRTGVPLAWNPGRNPRGEGVQALTATSQGLWIGSDTDYVGNRQYFRPKLAFFPLVGGKAPASEATGSLPGDVYLGGQGGRGTTNVLYRVDAGGPTIGSTDSGPDWAADDQDTSPYRNPTNNSATWSPVPQVDGTVPAGTPSALFDSERWDGGSAGDGDEMSWAFPVSAGKTVQVRLYFANRYSGTSQTGQRVFNVGIEGNQVLNNFDIVAAAGDQTGTMRQFSVVSDGTVNIDFGHVTENPLINGIEIVDPSVTPVPPGPTGLKRRAVAAAGVTAENDAPDGGLDWSTVRGAVKIGSEVWYARTDGNFYRRAFNGSTWGTPVVVDPYNDPVWSNVQTGSGQTYKGVRPSFYSELTSVTGMAYDNGRLFYTRTGDTRLFYRFFSPDSGVVTNAEFTVAGVTLPAGADIAIGGGKLYYVDPATGTLFSVTWTGQGTTGSPNVVSGAGSDGYDWRGRALFLS